MTTSTARAAVLTAPRTFELREFPLPSIGDDDALLRIEACGLCGSDWDQYLGHGGCSLPTIPGHEIIGTIDKIGKEARARWGLDEGDRVAVDGTAPCGSCRECSAGAYKRCTGKKFGYGLHVQSTVPPFLWGGYATHAYLHPHALLQRLPADIPTGVMSLLNAMSNAVAWTAEVGGVSLGERVVICGPGQRGLLAVVAAREAGAEKIIITGTKQDAYRLQVARELGATATIDVDAIDPVAAVMELTHGAGVDLVVDVSARAIAPIVQALDMVRPGGTIVLAGIKGAQPVSLLTDKLIMKEVRLIGAFSSKHTANEKAINIIRRNAAELARLSTHAYRLTDANKALQVLGREVVDGPEAIHIYIAG